MCGKALFCHFVHSFRAYLYLNPSALLAHQSYVQSLISVGLGVVDPVAQTVGVRLVDLAYRHIYVEAFVDFLFTFLWLEDYSYSQNVVNLVEAYVLVLHLVPDGVGAFHPGFYFIFKSHPVESLLYWTCKVVKQTVERRLCVCQFRFY